MDTPSYTPTLTEAQALEIIQRGVTREAKQDFQRTLAYCKDATNLRGFNVRKLSQKLEVRAEEKGETFNSDSYQSNISNANGVMGLFDYDLVEFEAWLSTQSVKSLQAIFKAFRALFVPAKPKAEKPEGDKDTKTDETPVESAPLIDVVLSALPHLTAEERTLVAMMLIELDTADADAQPADVAA